MPLGFRPLPFRRPARARRRVPRCLCRWRRPDQHQRGLLIVGRKKIASLKPSLHLCNRFDQLAVRLDAVTLWPFGRLQAGAVAVQVGRFEMPLISLLHFVNGRHDKIGRAGNVCPRELHSWKRLRTVRRPRGCAAFARPASFRQRSRHQRSRWHRCEHSRTSTPRFFAVQNQHRQPDSIPR